MPYVEEICLALVRALEHASFHKDVRMAGYAANIDFWAAEIRHAMDCLAGYETRFERLKAARIEHAKRLKVEVEATWIAPTMTAGELAAVGDHLRSAATHFLRSCRPFLDASQVADLEQLLGIRIADRRRQD
jgi:hypothetical protein